MSPPHCCELILFCFIHRGLDEECLDKVYEELSFHRGLITEAPEAKILHTHIPKYQ